MDKIKTYEIENEHLKAVVLNYGATVHKLIDKKTNKELLLSFDNLEDYKENYLYLNAICGPTAGRIANAMYECDGVVELSKNNDEHHLHGGEDSYARKYFDCDVFENKMVLTLETNNVEYPGTQDIKITYELKGMDFTVSFEADTDHPIPMNLTSHMYFTAFGNQSVLENQMRLQSEEKMILQDMAPVGFKKCDDYKELSNIEMLDEPFILNGNQPAVEYIGKDLSMEVITDYDTVVIYTQNSTFDFFERTQMGICFETQKVPNGVNIDGYDAMLEEGHYKHQTTYRFRR